MTVAVSVSNLNDDPNGVPIKKIKVTPRLFIRDVLFCAITVCYLLFIFLQHH